MSIIRHFKRKFSISAPQLSVRPHVPWYLRWALVLPFILIAGSLVWWAYDNGLQLAGFHRMQAEDERSRLQQMVSNLQRENAKLSNEVVDYERQLQMEHAANAEMERQLKALNEEKVHLNDDLAFFQNLTQSGSREEKLTIHRITVVRDTLPGEYHCSLLLVQSGQRAKDFRGRMQLLANVQRNGVKSIMVFPQDTAQEAAAYQLDFKYYQRVERSFRLPQDVTLDSVEVRIYERGASEPKIKQEAALS